MLYNIKGTSLEITGANRSYVEKRISLLDKFFGARSGARLDVELEFMKDEEKKFRAEGTIHDHGFEHDFRVEATGDTAHEAIDIMVNTLNLELSREKKKHITQKRKGAARFKDFIRGFTDKF